MAVARQFMIISNARKSSAPHYGEAYVPLLFSSLNINRLWFYYSASKCANIIFVRCHTINNRVISSSIFPALIRGHSWCSTTRYKSDSVFSPFVSIHLMTKITAIMSCLFRVYVSFIHFKRLIHAILHACWFRFLSRHTTFISCCFEDFLQNRWETEVILFPLNCFYILFHSFWMNFLFLFSEFYGIFRILWNFLNFTETLWILPNFLNFSEIVWFFRKLSELWKNVQKK